MASEGRSRTPTRTPVPVSYIWEWKPARRELDARSSAPEHGETWHGTSAVSRRARPLPKPRSKESVGDTGSTSAASRREVWDTVRAEREEAAFVQRLERLPEPRGLHPLSADFPTFPAAGLRFAMAFDGELYDKPAFFSYYGDAAARIWNVCQVRTHAAACFVHLWFTWTVHAEQGRDLMLRVGEFFGRSIGWLLTLRGGKCVSFSLFRALALRDEFVALHDLRQTQGNFNNEWARKQMIEIATTWTAKYIVHGEAANKRTRSILRFFWQNCFGHKDFALLVAT